MDFITDNALAIGVVAFLIIMVLWGMKRGLIKMLVSTVIMIASMLATAILFIPVSAIVEKTPIADSVKDNISKVVLEADVVDIDSISNLNLPETVTLKLQDGAADTQAVVAEYVADKLGTMIIDAASFLIVFVIVYIVLRVLAGVLNIVAKLPGIHALNKLAGAIVGFVWGFALIWVMCLILPAFASHEWAMNLSEQINNNQFLTFIYNNNLLVNIITKNI